MAIHEVEEMGEEEISGVNVLPSPQTARRARMAPILTRLSLAALLFLTACGPQVRSSSPDVQAIPDAVAGKVLPKVGRNYMDANIDGREGSPLVTSIRFRDSLIGGRIRMTVCFTGYPGEIRIISQQQNQVANSGPGYLYNHPSPMRGDNCNEYDPVIGVEPGEEDYIIVGGREMAKPFLWFWRPGEDPYDDSYTGRVYQSTRATDSDNLEIWYLGMKKIDPSSVVPRSPNEPAEYFVR